MARGSSGIKMPTEFEEALNQSFFKRLFVSERKQIAMIADEKSPARISHRIFATRSLRNRGSAKIHKLKIFARHFVSQAPQSAIIAEPKKIWLAVPSALKCLRNRGMV